MSFAVVPVSDGRAADKPADSLNQLFGRLRQCMRTAAGPPGAQITIRFSLKRDGSLLGRPKVTFSVLPRDDARRRAFVAAVAGAFAGCVPVPITGGLGGAIAGRPMTFRVVVTAPTTGT